MKTKRFTASLLAVCVLVMAFSTTLASMAFATVTDGTGAEIRISNDTASTGLTLSGRSFDVYEIFTATLGTYTDDDGNEQAKLDETGNQIISYDVSEDFVPFFLWIFEYSDDDKLYDDAYGDEYEETYYNFDDFEDAYEGTFTVTLDELIETVMADNDFQTNAYDYVTSYEDDMATFVDYLRYFVLREDENGESVYGISPLEINWTEISTSGTVQSIMTETNRSLLGYYLVLDSADTYTTRDQDDEDVSTASVITAGALATVPSRNTDGTLSRSTTIYIKASAPTLTKEVWHNDIANSDDDVSPTYGITGSWDTVSDYQIGDTIEFRLTAGIPINLEGYANSVDEYGEVVYGYTYIITDEPEDGISINIDSIEVFTDAALTSETTGGNHHVIEHEDGSFSLVFDMITISKMVNGAVSEFYIYYTATIDATAIVSMEYETNTASLTYSTNPYDYLETNTIYSDVYVYTFDLDVLKTSGDEISPLEYATFALYELSIDGTNTKTQIYLEQLTDATGKVIYNYIVDEDNDTTIEVPVYVVTNQSGATDVITDEFASVGTITTDYTGRFNIIGLDDATTYVLTEINAPDGYNAADPLSFTIEAKYDTTTNSDGTPNLTLTTTSSSDITASGNVLSTIIVNTSSALLPSTGGMGTTLLTYGGIILMVGAATAFFIKRKKM